MSTHFPPPPDGTAETPQSGLPFRETRPGVRASDPDTSREAWHSHVRPRLNERQAAVAFAIDRRGVLGATSLEVARDLNVDRDSISSRFSELETLEVIVRAKNVPRFSGATKRHRPGTSVGARSQVWLSTRVVRAFYPEEEGTR